MLNSFISNKDRRYNQISNKLSQKKPRKGRKESLKNKVVKKSMEDGFEEGSNTIFTQSDDKEEGIEAEENDSETNILYQDDFDESSGDDDDYEDYSDEVNIFKNPVTL